MHAHEMHAHETHAREMHVHEIHAREMHAREVHAYPVRGTRHFSAKCIVLPCAPHQKFRRKQALITVTELTDIAGVHRQNTGCTISGNGYSKGDN